MRFFSDILVFFGGLPAILGFHGNFFDLHQAFGRVVLKPRGQPRVSVLLGFALRRAGSELRVWTEVQGLPPTVIAAVRQIFGGGGHVILGAGVRSKEGACQQDGRAQHKIFFHDSSFGFWFHGPRMVRLENTPGWWLGAKKKMARIAKRSSTAARS